MRKLFPFVVAVIALLAFVAAPTMADNCTKTAKSTSAQKVTDKTHCAGEDAAACAAKLGISLEECKKLCGSGDHAMINMSIEGMTCGSCENSIKATLKTVPGVMMVGTVSHENGSACLMVDPKKVDNTALIKAVTSKGYKAAIVQAGEKETVKAKVGCSPAVQKACSPKCAITCGAKKTTTDKTEGGK